MFHTSHNSYKRVSQALARVFNSATLKQLAIVGAMVSVGLLALHIAPEAHAQLSGNPLIDPADSPPNIATATNSEPSIRALVRTVINFFLFFLGMVATIMVIYGGVLYVTAAGNDDQVGKAKNVIMYAVVGIIVILISFALINTVLGAGSGTAPAVQGTGSSSGTGAPL